MKALIRLVLWVAGLALVVVIAAAAVLATLDPNDHKEWIAAKVKEETGRTIKLDGNLALTIYPWLGVELNDVTLGNAPGFGDEPFLKFGHLKARIKFLPALREQYEIDTVSLHGAVLNLARNEAGATNWDDLAKGGEEQQAQPLPLTAIVLGGVDIQKMRINWADATTGAKYEISDLTASTGPLTYGAPIQLALTTGFKANKPALNANAKLDGTIAYDLDNEIYSVKPLALAAKIRGANIPGGETDLVMSAAIDTNLADETASISGLKLGVLNTTVDGEVKAARIESPTPSVQATLKVNGSDLALLFKVLEIEPLAGQLAELSDRSFKLDSSVDADMERGDVNLSNLTASLLGANIKGDLKAVRANTDTPGVRGQLTAAGPDLAAVLRVLGQFQKDKRLNRVGNQAATAAQRDFRIETAFDADMKTGDVNVPAFSADLLGAKVRAKLVGKNMHTDKPALNGSVDASGADLALLMRTVGVLDPKSALLDYGKKLKDVKDRSFQVKTDFNADLKSGNVDLPALDARALGLTVAGKMAAKNMESSSGSVNGELSVRGGQLGELLRAVDQADLADTLQSVELDARISGSRADLSLKPLELKAVVMDQEVTKKPQTFALKADTRVNMDKEQLDLSGLSVTGLGLNVSGDIKGNKVLSAPEFAGNLNVAEFNLRQTMRRLGQKVPVMADKEALRSVSLQTQFSGSKTGVTLKPLALVLDGSNLKGDFSFNNPEQPVVRFALDIDQIDFDRYLPPDAAAKKGEAAPPPEAAAAGAATQLPVELLRTLDVQGNLQVGRLVYAKAKLTNVKVSVNGKAGNLKIDPVTAQLYQGTYNGSVALDATGKLPKLTLNSKLTGVEIEPLLKDMQGKAKLRGNGDFSMALVAAGADTDVMKKSLNGQMGFVFRNGAVKGFNLGKILRGVKQFKKEGDFSVENQEETDFTEITGNPVATNGVVRLDDFDGKSPAFRFSGKGVIADLPRDRIDYVVQATVVGTSKGQGGADLADLGGLTIPVKIKGPRDNPKISPDLGAVAMEVAKKQLLNKVGVPQGTTAPAGAPPGAVPTTDPKQQLLDEALKGILKPKQ